jgi:opacity protein-like surface antigen
MKSLKFLAAIVAAFCMTAAAFAAEASPAGTWKWTVQGRQGGQGFEQTLKLDYKDGKLTGTLLGSQAGQFQVPDTPIADASFQGGTIKFAVTREFNGRSFTTKYEGKLDEDTIKGTFERPGMNGGDPVKREWSAKRQK